MGRHFSALCLLFAAHLGCPAVVRELPPEPSEGGGGAGAAGGGSTASVGAFGGGGTGGTGGEGGTPCVLGTACDPIATGKVFEGAGVGRAIAVDAEGDILVYGTFQELEIDGQPLVSNGVSDLWLAKLDALTGDTLWVSSFGTADWDKSTNLAVDADSNVIITGTAREAIDFGGGPVCESGFTQVFLAKFDRDGNHVFSRCFGDPTTSTGGPDVSLATTPTGEIILAGNSTDDVDLGTGMLPFLDGMVFVATFTPNGETLWARRYVEWSGDLLDAMTRSLAVSPSGDIFLASSFRGVMDFEGEVYDSDGDGAIAVARLRPDGTLSWVKALRGEQISGVALASSPTEGVIVSGTQMEGFMDDAGVTPIDGTLVALTADGALDFATNLMGGAYEVDQSAVASDGSIVALATVYVEDEPEVVLSTFAADGSPTWSTSFGRGDGFDLALGGETLAITGVTAEEMDFGEGPIATDGVFVAWFVPWQDALGLQSP